MGDYRFPDHPGKNASESVPVLLDWYGFCANFWRPNEQFTLNEFARPRRPTGFSYQATTAGLSGRDEPQWPTVLGLKVKDGSVEWTCTAAGANGLNAISSPSVTPDPPGSFTCTGAAVVENTKVQVTYEGGIEGQHYDAVCQVTINGVPRIGRQRVPVKRR